MTPMAAPTADSTTRPAPRAGFGLAWALAALLLPAGAGAQEPVERPDTFALPEIVVTATRVPLHRDALPNPVTVLTGADLRDRGIRTVADALREVPGAAVVRAGSHGAQTSVFLRGGESDYVKVLIDGVPVNEPGGAIDFADLSTDQVERIEVVRGPVSVLYGTDAVAGVVQIFTRRGRGAPALAVTAAGGRGSRTGRDDGYGTMDAEATLSGSAGPVAYAIGGGRFWTAGMYPTNNQRSLNVGTARIGWSPAPGTELALTTRYGESRSHFPTDGAGNVVDGNAYLDRDAWTASLEAGRRLTSRLDARVQAGVSLKAQSSVDPRDDEADPASSRLDTDVDRRMVEGRLSLDLPRSIATAGVALDWSRGSSEYASESEFGPYEASARFRRANRGYFLQLLTNPLEPLDVTLGGRLDDNDQFGTFRTYRLGASYRLPWGTRLRGALGRGFREPTFGESYGSGFGDTGNRELDPERSLSAEVGLEHEVALRAGAVRVGATYFHQRFEDLIQYAFDPDPADPGRPDYYNVGAARAAGIEITAEARAGGWTIAAGFTGLGTEVLDPGLATDASFREGEPLLRRPARSGSLAATYAAERGRFGLTLNAAGQREDVDYGATFPYPRVTLPAYATLDLAAEHDLPRIGGQDLTALLRVENLADTDYEPVSGFPAPGRLIYLGFRLVAGGS